MKKILFAISMIFCFMNMQCSDDDTNNVDSDNLLIGSWVEPTYDGEEITYKRANALPEKDYGILFKENGSFVERSSGWCGTPPLSFFDSNGEWTLTDKLVTITQEQYPINYAWRIVSLTKNKLVVKIELTEQEKDHRKLMDLFNEIYQLSTSISCTNANDWTFTAYGSKACGGPQGFIAYSTQIDTVGFLQKVKEYTNLEHAYNIKWNIVSTCDLPAQPKEVTCENGLPVLKY
ncbi:lipocalin-like domain-containing protein [Flavivirga rizhaonensis]|uniref:Lipocalin-like domain-containing protein n=1 Tax=Flavivirga rizhaonensis TaxID=2559571 RepID=A0A4S1DWI1_9FLAO|nr:lipocalin family protein [Flavivirga rizhaonensis]TGV02496.1 hypothetical protein EM932_11130 [Flavivirga rizhaonensis]